MSTPAIIGVGLALGLVLAKGIRGRSGPHGFATPIPELHDARRIPEGFILGAVPRDGDPAILKRLGVREVLSLVVTSTAFNEGLAREGIRHVVEPMGATVYQNHVDAILAAPTQTYIHCTHGVDRTGALVAIALVRRWRWSVGDAFWAVCANTATDTAGMAALLAEAGVNDARGVDGPGVGIYAHGAWGGSGGTKTRGDYAPFVRSALGWVT